MGKPETHVAYLPVRFEKTLDLRQRAQQAGQLQQVISQFVVELLSNGKALTCQVAIERQKQLEQDEFYMVAIYWREAHLHEVLHKMDMQMFKRCVKCGNPFMEGHECHQLTPSQGESLEGEQPSGILKLGTPPSDGTGLVSTG